MRYNFVFLRKNIITKLKYHESINCIFSNIVYRLIINIRMKIPRRIYEFNLFFLLNETLMLNKGHKWWSCFVPFSPNENLSPCIIHFYTKDCFPKRPWRRKIKLSIPLKFSKYPVLPSFLIKNVLNILLFMHLDNVICMANRCKSTIIRS